MKAVLTITVRSLFIMIFCISMVILISILLYFLKIVLDEIFNEDGVNELIRMVKRYVQKDH